LFVIFEVKDREKSLSVISHIGYMLRAGYCDMTYLTHLTHLAIIASIIYLDSKII
jgi:hypothetical protein